MPNNNDQGEIGMTHPDPSGQRWFNWPSPWAQVSPLSAAQRMSIWCDLSALTA
jgi:hypothetical protein